MSLAQPSTAHAREVGHPVWYMLSWFVACLYTTHVWYAETPSSQLHRSLGLHCCIALAHADLAASRSRRSILLLSPFRA